MPRVVKGATATSICQMCVLDRKNLVSSTLYLLQIYASSDTVKLICYTCIQIYFILLNWFVSISLLFLKKEFFPRCVRADGEGFFSHPAKIFTAPSNQMKYYIKPYLFLESIGTVGIKWLVQLSQVFRFYFRVMISISLAGFSAFFKHICETDIRHFEIWFIKKINVSCV